MPIPKEGTKEWEKEKELYSKSTPEWREQRSKELGYATANHYTTVMNRRGIHLEAPDITKATEQEINQINLPPIKLKKYIPINSGRVGDPETAVLHMTDNHDGEITPTYNHQVYLDRLGSLFQSVMRIVTLHRNIYPINDLVVPITGDMVHGENPYQGAKVEAISSGVKNQIFNNSLPALAEFFLSLKQEFHTVRLECVPGNHGRYSKESPTSSNWDLVLYESLKLKLEPYDVKVNISEDFCKIIDIQGQKFFLFHGHQCKATQGVPYFSLSKKIMSWYVTYGGFDYAVCGHFHKDDLLRVNKQCKLIMGASMVSDDPYALEVIGTSSPPSQWIFGVHKRKGLTWNYALIVDDKYFPAADSHP